MCLFFCRALSEAGLDEEAQEVKALAQQLNPDNAKWLICLVRPIWTFYNALSRLAFLWVGFALASNRLELISKPIVKQVNYLKIILQLKPILTFSVLACELRYARGSYFVANICN